MIVLLIEVLVLLVMLLYGYIFVLRDLLSILTTELYVDITKQYEECNWTSEGEDKDEI